MYLLGITQQLACQVKPGSMPVPGTYSLIDAEIAVSEWFGLLVLKNSVQVGDFDAIPMAMGAV
jgi:hypothetical protein